MNRDEIISTLRACEQDLRTRGVRHAALFGSVARGTAGPQSDIDIMIEIDHATVRDVYTYVGLAQHIAELFPADKVDVVNRNALKPYVRPPAEADAVYAF
jgi:predicted nucleotidyltransferase